MGKNYEKISILLFILSVTLFANESVTLNGFNSYKQGSLGKNLIGDYSLIEYSVSGIATSSDVPSDQIGNIGYIAVSYYGEEAMF